MVHMLPSNVTIGLVNIDCKTVKVMLSGKHKQISSNLFNALQEKVLAYANEIVAEFQEMFDKLIIPPTDIEQITELREYMASLPQKIDAMGDRITKNDLYFKLLEDAKWKIPIDQMDLHWEVFRWPSKMHQEMANVEKNLRLMEHNKQTEMEEEQADFAQDLSVLQGDVAKLKSLTQLADASANAENVRRIKKTIAEYEERARLFNSREGLFNSVTTDYAIISEQTRVFEPFYDLWDCADRWLSNKETWTNGAFLDLAPLRLSFAEGACDLCTG